MAETPTAQRIFLDTANLEEVKKWHGFRVIDGVTTNQSIMAQEGVSLGEIPTLVKNICAEVAPRSVSVELSSSRASIPALLEEASQWRELGDNITLKVPVIPGTTKTLELIQALRETGISLNITAMTRYGQTLLPILALRGYDVPSFVSVFGGRSTEQYWRYIVPQERAAEKQLHQKLTEDLGKRSNNGSTEEDLESEIQRRLAETVESRVNRTPSNIIKATAEFLTKGGEGTQNVSLIVGSIRNATAVEEFFAAGADIVTIPPKILLQMLDSERTRETNEEFDGKWAAIVARDQKRLLTPSKP